MIEITSVMEEGSLFYCFVIIRNLTKYFSQSLWPVKLFKPSRLHSSSAKKAIFIVQSNDQKSLYASLFIIHLIYFNIMLITKPKFKACESHISLQRESKFGLSEQHL